MVGRPIEQSGYKEGNQSFSKKVKHLIRFSELKNNYWINRLASHPRFLYWVCNEHLLWQGNFHINQHSNVKYLTFEEVKVEMVVTHSLFIRLCIMQRM